MTQTTSERIAEFCDKLNAMYEALYRDKFTALSPPNFFAQPGRKNVRIVQCDSDTGGQRSVYCFIDKATGDIYKAAGWKAPAKGVRGSIWNDNCDVGADKPANLYGSGLYK